MERNRNYKPDIGFNSMVNTEDVIPQLYYPNVAGVASDVDNNGYRIKYLPTTTKKGNSPVNTTRKIPARITTMGDTMPVGRMPKAESGIDTSVKFTPSGLIDPYGYARERSEVPDIGVPKSPSLTLQQIPMSQKRTRGAPMQSRRIPSDGISVEPQRVPFSQVAEEIEDEKRTRDFWTDIETNDMFPEQEGDKNVAGDLAATENVAGDLSATEKGDLLQSIGGKIGQAGRAAGNLIGRGLQGLGGLMRDETREGHRWRDTMSGRNQWVIPGDHANFLKSMALAEGQADHEYNKNNDLANARMAQQIRMQAQQLDKQYMQRTLGGDPESNKANYIKALEVLNIKAGELGLTPFTPRFTSQDPQLRTQLMKQMQPLEASIEQYNQFADPNISQETKNLIAQNLMREISGDRGALSDQDVARFSFAALTPAAKETIRSGYETMINAMVNAATISGDSMFATNFRNAVRAADSSDNLLDKSATIKQAIQNVQAFQPDKAAYIPAMQQAFDTWLKLTGRSIDTDNKAIQTILGRRVSLGKRNLDDWMDLNYWDDKEKVTSRLDNMIPLDSDFRKNNYDVSHIKRFSAPPMAGGLNRSDHW